MNGPTLTMAARAVELQRSHSSPDLYLNASALTKSSMSISSPNTLSDPASPGDGAISEPSSPAGFEMPSFDFGSGVETSLSIPSNLSKVDTAPNQESAKVDAVRLKPPPEPMTASRPATKPRSKSIVDRPRSWLASKTGPSEGSEQKEKGSLFLKSKKTEEKDKDGKDTGKNKNQLTPERKALSSRDRSTSFRSSSFAEFAKKSWITSSRSPSPKRDRGRKESIKEEDNADRSTSPKKDVSLLSPHKRSRRRLTAGSSSDNERSKSAESLSGTSRALNRASVYLGKIKQQKPSEPVKANASLVVPPQGPATKNETVSPAASTRSASDNFEARRWSQTDLSSTSDSSSGGTGSTGITEPSQASENMAAQKAPRPRDPLWTTFRRLDSEYAIFLTKSTTSQRMLIARNTLIPFLRNHSGNSSNKDNMSLSPEDIDRRATILHKWWNGLLELLEGTATRSPGPAMTFAAIQAHNTGLQPVSGVDRPGLLELITHLMMRPEWRMATPSLRPLKDRSPQEGVRSRAATADSTDFFAESAEHNVRTMFINNLLTQISIVVERMSSRHAPTSLVTFAGKVCAYAFFFVPGIAEVLVRLWGLAPDLLRRVADEFGLPRRSKGESDDIVALFPTTLHKLGWTSVKAMTDNLRLTTKLSLVAAKIPWHGPWVARWRGGDTDLFFIFCKYYYILAEEFMPQDLPLFEKARAPGFALIHAQLLSVLDTTIHHRQAAFENMMTPNILDSSNGADAMAAALSQLPPSNLLRGMDENRLIVLLKDILAENSIGGLTTNARETFATAFMLILKAATKKTPVFKQPPVLVLIDFYHEVLLALDAYTGYTDPEYQNRQLRDHVDWSFWLDVCNKILFESNSTMLEIRMLSFIFAAWDILTADPARKEKLVIDWLLSEKVFDKFFNNYTPMVRAYFMRLLCWRICRDQGSSNELDMRIFCLVSDRLKKAWSHYLWLKQAAEAAGKLPPSTAPCHPQPGKRFMIIRMETTPPQSGLLHTGFDTMSNTLGGYEIGAAIMPSSDERSSDSTTNPGELISKKRWSIFGKMLSFTSATAPGGLAAVEAARRASTASNDELEAARKATAAERSNPPPPPPPKASPSSRESDASSTGSTPVFDAAQFIFKFTLGALPWIQTADMDAATSMLSTLPRDRPLGRPRLPAPAQARVSSRMASTSSRSDSPPPPSPGLPAPERMYSGTSQRGLISEARNAAPLEADSDSDSPNEEKPADSLTLVLPEIRRVTSTESVKEDSVTSPISGDDSGNMLGVPQGGRPEGELQTMQPTQPIGIFKERATYSGRALSEWCIVVHECNSFIDRRRDEGVCGLKEVEVPSLGVENLRRMG